MRRTLVLLFVLALVAASAATMFHTHDAVAQGPPTGPGVPGGPGGPGAPGGPGPGGPAGPAGMRGGPPRPYEWNPAEAETTIVHMLAHIKGKEDMPAESVYKNIKILNGMPAKRVPRIMVMGFGRSLGMRCGGCHRTDDFASDERGNKRVARQMWAMTMDLNKKYLPEMKDLEDELPTVNCWTCHRGNHHPATDADAPPDTSSGMQHGEAQPPKPQSAH